MKIGVVGWGYVGATTGLGLRTFHEILVYDPFKDIEKFSIDYIGELPTKNLTDNLKHVDKLEKMAEADVIFVCLPTPTVDGKIDMSYIDNFFAECSKTLKKGMFVIRSTVSPGTTRKLQKKYPQYKFANNPEFLRERTPLHDFLYPSRIVIGSDNKELIDKLLDVYKPFECHKIVTNSDTSELIKYAANCFLATKISYFNEIHRICEKCNIDSKVVSEAVSLDERIGRYGIYGGRPFGGTCLPKDISAFIAHVKEVGLEPTLLNAVKNVNEEMTD
jgi:UDPglucose 6-dehydrogenase